MPEPEVQDPPLNSGPAGSRGVTEGGVALVALVTGAVSLLFVLFPGCKPFTATKLGASLRVLTVERSVTRDQWRWRVALGDPLFYAELVEEDAFVVSAPASEPCAVLGGAVGHVIFAATAVEGYKRQSLTVRAALYDGETKTRMPDIEAEEYRALERVPVDAPTERSVQEIWLYEPGGTPKYFARVFLYDPEDHLLDIADSRTFDASTPAELKALPKGCRTVP
jgi:hypothetical protein